MNYDKIQEAIFLKRPNRFMARVILQDGTEETVHVKNTGRCSELLVKNARVILSEADNPKRKTNYDLVAVYSPLLGWVNIDSQAPNTVMHEWLCLEGYDFIKPECCFGDSRFDFYAEKGAHRIFIEVKGCTLCIDGMGYFPDAPTLRGAKHLKELINTKECGYEAVLAFVIPMNGVERVQANEKTDPAFSEHLAQARKSGVSIWYMCCNVSKEGFSIIKKITDE